MLTRSQREVIERFSGRYDGPETMTRADVTTDVLGFPLAQGYTTRAQVDRLGRALRLQPGARALDVGAGAGWPSLYLAATTGADIVLTDVPRPAVEVAVRRARETGVNERCQFARASGTHLPFRARSFDAVLHTDVLC